MTTKTRTICTECADRYYEYEIGAESDEYCPACLFAKYKKALEEVEDTKQWASELEDSAKSKKTKLPSWSKSAMNWLRNAES
ncbi:hypothetical protein LCGC14_1281440 [marine sediment metagenome]|uniref:Zinc ribbon domain-containing protein n=1 Tax=marine sediment metagenome TaxID=412755 RepID=A0A0F9KWQ8_9ZZZZ